MFASIRHKSRWRIQEDCLPSSSDWASMSSTSASPTGSRKPAWSCIGRDTVYVGVYVLERYTHVAQVDTQCRASCARARGGCVRCGSAYNRSSLRRVFSSPPFPRCRLPTRSFCTARRYRRVLWSFCSCAILLAAARHRRRRPADEVPSARPLQ